MRLTLVPLALHVFGAHVHNAFQAQTRRHRGGRNSVLSRAGFGDDAPLAHSHGQQSLPEAVVDFVRAGMQQVFALNVDARPAQVFGQPRSELQRRRPTGEITQQRIGFAAETFLRARAAR